MKGLRSVHGADNRDITPPQCLERKAIGYIRVSTDAQATDGLSLDAQTRAIEHYCAAHGIRLIRICRDVISGAKTDRVGLQEALATLQRGADVLVVLKFDRLSRSIRHFCELYEQYFKSGEKELVAIREAIRLDSSLGRALVNILLVFAQMEREATAERTREAVRHIMQRGYHYGKAPYGYKKAPAPDQPRFRVLVEDSDEQYILSKIKAWLDEGRRIPAIVAELNSGGVRPPQSSIWRTSFLYLLVKRYAWHEPQPHNERWHTDEELKAHIVELRERGHTLAQIASLLNEQKWMPLKGRKFTRSSVGKLLRGIERTEYLSPRQYLEGILRRMEQEHQKVQPDEPFMRPAFPRLAILLKEARYLTPKGHDHWWPAQVQQLLDGRFDQYYGAVAKAG